MSTNSNPPLSRTRELGQFFTPPWIGDLMASMLTPNPQALVLEPAAGTGVLINALLKVGFQEIKAYEVDSTLTPICPAEKIQYQSFIDVPVEEKFDRVIGNPPYVRWRNMSLELRNELSRDPVWATYCSSLSDYLAYFVVKSVLMLKPHGELVFITSDYWLSTTHSKRLREFLAQHGAITHIVNFNESPVFSNVASSVIVFKFVKGLETKPIDVQSVVFSVKDIRRGVSVMDRAHCYTMRSLGDASRWSLAVDQDQDSVESLELICGATFGDFCEVGNGLVSGLDKAFQYSGPCNDIEKSHLLPVIKAKAIDRFRHGYPISYVFIDRDADPTWVRESMPHFYEHLEKHRHALESRFSYGRDLRLWEWALLRSYPLFSQNVSKIFVPCKVRVSKTQALRFCLVKPGFYPTQDVSALVPKFNCPYDIRYLVALLNHPRWLQWFKYRGVVKGGVLEFSEKPLIHAPLFKVDFNSTRQRDLYDQIIELVDQLCHDNSKQAEYLEKQVVEKIDVLILDAGSPR